MPFLKAGFNARNRATGIRAYTVHYGGNRGGWKPAELRQFKCGDYFWLGDSFLAWGECVRFRNFFHVNSWGLPQSPWPRENKKARRPGL